MSHPLLNYKNNPRLKRVGQEIPFQRDQIEEYIRCKNDVVYFLNNYFQIVTIDKGKQIIELWDYQEEIINLIHEHLKYNRSFGQTDFKNNHCLWIYSTLYSIQ